MARNISSSSNSEEEGGGISLERPILEPNRKLLVLSLGGLLCQRVCRRDIFNIPKSRAPDAAYGSILVYKRPYSEEFMRFCFERFDVGIWSSAREWYLNNALDCVMGELRNKLLFFWDQPQCTNSGFCAIENKKKPIFLKELNKLWESLPTGRYSSSNTLLIDDKPYKALLNPPYTAVFLTEYEADHLHDTGLGPEGELCLYLDGLAKADDVPTYVKNNPFGQPAITAMHPDWDYYSKIISSHSKEQATNV